MATISGGSQNPLMLAGVGPRIRPGSAAPQRPSTRVNADVPLRCMPSTKIARRSKGALAFNREVACDITILLQLYDSHSRNELEMWLFAENPPSERGALDQSTLDDRCMHSLPSNLGSIQHQRHTRLHFRTHSTNAGVRGFCNGASSLSMEFVLSIHPRNCYIQMFSRT